MPSLVSLAKEAVNFKCKIFEFWALYTLWKVMVFFPVASYGVSLVCVPRGIWTTYM